MSNNKDWDKRVEQYKDTTEQFSNEEIKQRLRHGIEEHDRSLSQDMQVQEVINRSIQGN